MATRISTSSSSAAAPAATSPRSAPRSSASTSPASTSGRTTKGGPAPGGTCTNVGCIPSKALLQSSENFEHAGHHFAEHGIEVKGLTLDLAKMLARKDTVVKQNNDGILYLFKKNKVTFFHGRGSFVEGGRRRLRDRGRRRRPNETLVGKHVIVATGSNARALPGAPFDEERILSQRRRAAHRRACRSGWA